MNWVGGGTAASIVRVLVGTSCLVRTHGPGQRQRNGSARSVLTHQSISTKVIRKTNRTQRLYAVARNNGETRASIAEERHFMC